MTKINHDFSEGEFKIIYTFLSEQAYWCNGISQDTLRLALNHSLCFIARNEENRLIGFARVVTDFATFANLLDVFVLPEYRGQGIGKSLISAVMEHHQLQGLRRFTLATRDAHGLYKQFGFTQSHNPHGNMEIYKANIYRS